MSTRARAPFLAARVGFALGTLAGGVALAAGCGGPGGAVSAAESEPTNTPVACADAVLAALRGVGRRIYHEGIASERTVVALRAIAQSKALGRAVENGDAPAARAAAQALVAGGRMVNVEILRNGRVLASAGASRALAPFTGPVRSASGTQVGTFVASVWGNTGLIEETTGVTGAETVIRRKAVTLDGKFRLPAGPLPAKGTLSAHGTSYAYTSFPASEYPSNAHLRVYLLRSIASTRSECGADVEDTTVKTLTRVAEQIYLGEAGSRAQTEVRRVQRSAPLIRAVLARDASATRVAIEALLNQHIVRMRVSAGGRLLSDVGGPYVLAPVSAVRRSGGPTIGRFTLSIQDDEGYLRLTRRLAGVYVLMYMGPSLVKNSLGPSPGSPPEKGRYEYRGRTYRTVTLRTEAFPSGPLRIVVLVPIPYS